jgi:REP element-mobilizing transposase RayT
VRFWKGRIEPTDAEQTFAVGLIFGPSGCGKSSLVKAGLLPRLAPSVVPIYVEAAAAETEARLLRGLRKHCPDLPATLCLVEALTALRRERVLPAGHKVLLVLDQFEQWLHAKRQEENTELVQALRQCDGGRLQCLVLVREDFWLAVSRFLDNLEVDLVPGRNVALVDVFDLRHARKVLTGFGRAFAALPEGVEPPSKEQNAFLEQALAGLAQDGKIISVRLALFAEMVKGKPWTPATLKEVGGMEGVGVTFLKETFSTGAANPRHRLHQKAAQAVLRTLLPEAATDIKGLMHSQQELQAASGYASYPKDFDDLLRILDSELRLITPTDPEGKQDVATSGSLVGCVPGTQRAGGPLCCDVGCRLDGEEPTVAPQQVITRRNLPHWYVPGAMHFPTYRLAGTIPQQVLFRLRQIRERRLQSNRPAQVNFRQHREQAHKQFFAGYDRYLDCLCTIDWLTVPSVAALIRGNLYHHDHAKYHLLAYCVMPNHVHVLLQPFDIVAASEPLVGAACEPPAREPLAATDVVFSDERADAESPLASVMHSLKSYTAHEANKLLGRTGQFWQHESYDHWVRDDDELQRIVDYIAWNPVKAKLVHEPHLWFFSSAHDRFLQDGCKVGYLG